MNRSKDDRRAYRDTGLPEVNPTYQKLFFAGLALAFLGASYFAFFGLFSNSSTAVVEAVDGEDNNRSSRRRKRDRNRITDYELYRQSVIDDDNELLADYRRQKDQRRAEAELSDNSVEYFDTRIAVLESDLELPLMQKTANVKGSLSWGHHQAIEKIKSDPPPGS